MSTMTLPRPAATQTDITLRPGTPDDAVAIGWICHEAFTTFSAQHNFPSFFPTPESGMMVHLRWHRRGARRTTARTMRRRARARTWRARR